MIDIHTHLYFPQYDSNRDETIQRAFDAGVEFMISVGTEPNDWEKAVEIARKDTRIFSALGLHPHFFNEQEPGNEDRLEWEIDELKRAITKHRDKIVAIGECGLDYFSHTNTAITREQKQWQRRGFEEQITLAQGFGLPVIVHCRPDQADDAYKDLLAIIRTKGGDTVFILHCYMGDTLVTEQFLTLPNVYFSFTGNITFSVKKSWEGTEKDIRETVKMIPLEKLLTETDCPFLAPVPHRGHRNEPKFVRWVAESVASLKGVTVEEVNQKVKDTAFRILRG